MTAHILPHKKIKKNHLVYKIKMGRTIWTEQRVQTDHLTNIILMLKHDHALEVLLRTKDRGTGKNLGTD